MKSVLIIEDNPTMRRGLEDNFEFKGYRVRSAWDGEQGLNTAMTKRHDLIILDIMLPKINGYEVCSRIRQKDIDTPIIMLTAKDQESDVVLGLNIGADDYMTKPFSIKELLARAEVFMRRRKKAEPAVYEFGNCRLDIASETFTRDDKKIELTPGEFKMLHLFLRKTGCVLSCDEIRDAVWGFSYFITLRDIDKSVNVLRNKVETDPDNPRFIRTVEGVGYIFEAPESNGNNTDS